METSEVRPKFELRFRNYLCQRTRPPFHSDACDQCAYLSEYLHENRNKPVDGPALCAGKVMTFLVKVALGHRGLLRSVKILGEYATLVAAVEWKRRSAFGWHRYSGNASSNFVPGLRWFPYF